MVLLILKNGFWLYQKCFIELADPRVENFFLMRNPLLPLGVLGLYLMFVLKWGPKFMLNRKPFNIDKIVILYNIWQIYLSTEILIRALRYTYGFGGYNLFCEPVDYSNSEKALIIAKGVHSYFMIKVLDLLDTVFFVLRKKNKQITFLHVYHHAGMLALVWGATKFLPGGQSIFIGLLNSVVHIIMYSYYLLTLLQPKFENNFWWKKHVTQLQIIQLALVLLHWISLAVHPFCGYPKLISALLIPQNFFLLVLFIEFYYKTYVKKKPTTANDIKEESLSDSISAASDDIARRYAMFKVH